MIPGGQWTTTKDGFQIFIVDYPERLHVPAITISEEKLNAISKMISDMRKEYDIKIICNGKEF